MGGDVTNQALFVALDHHRPEPVVVWLLPNFDAILLSWEDVSDEPCVVYLQEAGVVLEEFLHDSAGNNTVSGQSCVKNSLP